MQFFTSNGRNCEIGLMHFIFPRPQLQDLLGETTRLVFVQFGFACAACKSQHDCSCAGSVCSALAKFLYEINPFISSVFDWSILICLQKWFNSSGAVKATLFFWIVQDIFIQKVPVIRIALTGLAFHHIFIRVIVVKTPTTTQPKINQFNKKWVT